MNKLVYELKVTIAEDLVDELKRNKLKLCLVRSFRDPTDDNPKPTIWIAFQDYAKDNTFKWERTKGFQVYTSHSDEGRQIFIRHQIKPDEKFYIFNEKGEGKIDERKYHIIDGFMISNTTMKNFSCGIEQESIINGVKQSSTLISVLEVKGLFTVAIIPTEKVYVSFAPSNSKPGDVIHKSWYSGILVDMLDSDDELIGRQINIKRSLNEMDYEWETFPIPRIGWGIIISKNKDLIPYLIPKGDIIQLLLGEENCVFLS